MSKIELIHSFNAEEGCANSFIFLCLKKDIKSNRISLGLYFCLFIVKKKTKLILIFI